MVGFDFLQEFYSTLPNFSAAIRCGTLGVAEQPRHLGDCRQHDAAELPTGPRFTLALVQVALPGSSPLALSDLSPYPQSLDVVGCA